MQIIQSSKSVAVAPRTLHFEQGPGVQCGRTLGSEAGDSASPRCLA